MLFLVISVSRQPSGSPPPAAERRCLGALAAASIQSLDIRPKTIHAGNIYPHLPSKWVTCQYILPTVGLEKLRLETLESLNSPVNTNSYVLVSFLQWFHELWCIAKGFCNHPQYQKLQDVARFQNLNPKFCVHRVPDSERLPTSATRTPQLLRAVVR